jgi:hypothetical protein
MRLRLIIASVVVCLAVLGLASGGEKHDPKPLPPADLHLQAQLIWGTDDASSPDRNHKPVDPEIVKKIQGFLRWKYYFEVNRTNFVVAQNSSSKVTLSDKCGLEVRNAGDSAIEVSLIGKGTQVWKRYQTIKVGETLILGGNAPDSTAWLVTLKRTE